MKKYIIRDSKGQKTITYAKNIVDAVSHIKDRLPHFGPGVRVDMNYVKDYMWSIYNSTWFKIDKLKTSMKLKTKKELTLYITTYTHMGIQSKAEIYFPLRLKEYKSEADFIKHAEDLEKDLSRLVGKSYKEPLKKNNVITKTINRNVSFHPGETFYFDLIVKLASSVANIQNFVTEKSKVEVFNKDKITVSLPVVGNQTKLILLFTLLSKECKTKEEFDKNAKRLKDLLNQFSNVPSYEWIPMY